MTRSSRQATLHVVKVLLEYVLGESRSLDIAELEGLLEAALLAVEDDLSGKRG
jgi:hypothetical protein